MRHLLKFDALGNPIGMTSFEQEFEAVPLEDELLIETDLPADFESIVSSWRRVNGKLTHVGKGGEWDVWSQEKLSWVFDLKGAKEALLKDLKLRWRRKEVAGFVFDNAHFDSDSASLLRLQTEALRAQVALINNEPYENAWVLANNDVYQISNASVMLAIQNAAANHVKACHAEYNNFKTLINQANSKQELLDLRETL